MKYFLKPYEYIYIYQWSLLRSICANIRKSGGIKEGDNFPDFFHYFSFSHKLIKYFMKVVGKCFVIMHPDMHSRLQLSITSCFGRTEVHLFSFRG